MRAETPAEQAGGAPEKVDLSPLSPPETSTFPKNPTRVRTGKLGGRPRKDDLLNPNNTRRLLLEAWKSELEWIKRQLGPAGIASPDVNWLAATAKLTGFSDREILKGLWLRKLPKQTPPNTPCTTTP